MAVETSRELSRLIRMGKKAGLHQADIARAINELGGWNVNQPIVSYIEAGRIPAPQGFLALYRASLATRATGHGQRPR